MNSEQLSITGAFTVIAVLILAKHADWASNAITWLASPVTTGTKHG